MHPDLDLCRRSVRTAATTERAVVTERAQVSARASHLEIPCPQSFTPARNPLASAGGPSIRGVHATAPSQRCCTRDDARLCLRESSTYGSGITSVALLHHGVVDLLQDRWSV